MHEAVVPPATPGPTAAAHRDPRWALVVAILGSGMAFLDSTVVNVALPVMQRSLGATVSQLQWVVEAYALLLASLVLVGGALGDRLGRRGGLLHGGGDVRARLGRLWCRAWNPLAHRRAGRSRRRRGAPRPGKPGAHQRRFPTRKARRRDRHLVGLERHHGGGRAGGRRLGRLARLLALALLLQRPGRDGGRGAGDAPDRRDARSRRAEATGLAGAALATLGLGLVVYALIDAGPTRRSARRGPWRCWASAPGPCSPSSSSRRG